MDARPTYKPQNYKTHRKQHSKKKKQVTLDLVAAFQIEHPVAHSMREKKMRLDFIKIKTVTRMKRQTTECGKYLQKI